MNIGSTAMDCILSSCTLLDTAGKETKNNNEVNLLSHDACRIKQDTRYVVGTNPPSECDGHALLDLFLSEIMRHVTM